MTKDFSMIFHTDAEGASFDFGTEAVEFSDVMALVDSDVAADNVAQLFQFPAVTARYVGLRIDDHHGAAIAGGTRYGLGEVRFATEALIPEPASATLVLLGFGVLLRFRRR